MPQLTHHLNNPESDKILSMMRFLRMDNGMDDAVKLIFVPCYLTGDDGIINLSYYDVLLGYDLCVFPSYYEPWGYTPLESVAFKVPCITTDLAGFGLWVNKELGHYGELLDGVKVIHRTDGNYHEVADNIEEALLEYSQFTAGNIKVSRTNAEKISKKALWSEFIKYYDKAYDIALRNASNRIKL